MKAPLLSIGDGALGFWAAVRNVWPETRHQLCWVHKLKNVLDKLPKRLHGRAKSALNEIVKAETKEQAEEAVERFESDFGAKYPKAVASLTNHQDELLTFYGFPAQHWEHIRTANPNRVGVRHRSTPAASDQRRRVSIESPFHGLQATRHGKPPLASRQRAGTRSSSYSGREIRRRTKRRSEERRLTQKSDPQLLTISLLETLPSYLPLVLGHRENARKPCVISEREPQRRWLFCEHSCERMSYR